MDYALRRRWMKTLITLAVVGGAIFAFFIPTVVSSQPINPCEQLGGCSDTLLENADQDTVGESVTAVVLDVVRLLIYISMALAVLFIVYGGYQMLASSGDAEKFKKGRQTAISAVIGFGIALVSISIITLVGNILQGDLFGNGSTSNTQSSFERGANDASSAVQ